MTYYKRFQSICRSLFMPAEGAEVALVFDPADQLEVDADEPAQAAQQLNAAFLTLLSGKSHPDYIQAKTILTQTAKSGHGQKIASFYLTAVDRIRKEIESTCTRDQEFSARLKHLSSFLKPTPRVENPSQTAETIWSVFFPEGVGLSPESEKSVSDLRQRRAVNIQATNPKPIVDVAEEILFTSNVLLTVPSPSQSDHTLHCSEALKANLRKVSQEPQQYWYDHPIHIGVKPQNNELLYGLRGLAETLKFERKHGSIPKNARLTCLLSVSVTHQGLHETARPYIDEVLADAGFLNNLNVYVFTETDTQRIIKEVLAPAARYFLQHPDATNALRMIGVDGQYGRHYSFLKAVAAFWKVFVEPRVKATFKIDLDQVFSPTNAGCANRCFGVRTFHDATMGCDRNRCPGKAGGIGHDRWRTCQ